MGVRDLPRIDVFAVEDRSVQICWPGLPAPDLTLEVGGQQVGIGTAAPDWYGRVGLRGRIRGAATTASRRARRAAAPEGAEPGSRPRRTTVGVTTVAAGESTVPAGESPVPAGGSPLSAGGSTLSAGGSTRPAGGSTRPAGGSTLPAGPGAVTIRGLEPGTTYDVLLRGPGRPRTRVATVTTLPPPPGRLLSRFATISDCHIGEPSIGPLAMFRDPQPRPPGLDPYPVRCARAAVIEAQAWGAELLVAKGDLTYNGALDEVNDAADVLQTTSLPVEVILGNHDVRGPADAARILSARGLPMTLNPRARELPGVRLVLGHTPLPDRHAGAVTREDAAELARLAGAPGGPVVVALHHPPSRWPVQTHYPPSIVWRDTTRLVDELAAANRNTLIIAGHTHRNRRYRVRGLTVAEVASTKDYPGVWAGYSVYEGGIRQAVYRVAAPPAIAWTEITRRAIGGIWGRWSPGRLADRCWTLEWS